MKETPYNLYIHFDKLNAIISRETQREKRIVKCAMTSVELMLNLLSDVTDQKKNDRANLIDDILSGIDRQLNLLLSMIDSISKQDYHISHLISFDSLLKLDKGYSKKVDVMTGRFLELVDHIGLAQGDQINYIRRQFGLPIMKDKTKKTDPMAAFSDGVKSLQLNELPYFNTEDKLFMITHQVSECWFRIVVHELKEINEFLTQENLGLKAVGRHFKIASDVMAYLADHILILENMVLSDYHPLRVALRGASGGQSQQAHQIFQAAKEAFSNYLSLISDKELTVMTILERPADFPYLLSVINHFTKLERVLKNFFFQHYVLSSGIIGSQSFGSIGYDLVSLVDKFVEPIFKEIDQAKYDLTLKTNFAYGDISGSLIARKEGDYSLEGNISKADSNLTETTIGNYFEAISKLDMDLWLSQFNENGYIEDPVGSRPYLGHQQLKIFFKGVVRFFTKLNMTIESIIDDGMYTSVRWKAKATTYHEKQLQFEGEEVFGFCENGKILTATVHWNPAVISEQL